VWPSTKMPTQWLLSTAYLMLLRATWWVTCVRGHVLLQYMLPAVSGDWSDQDPCTCQLTHAIWQ
jgi:hypothetical protein